MHSPLTNGILLTNNCSKPRNHKVDRITPHYMCWYTDGKTCCESFLPSSRQASANYCIGKDGDIWLNVDEVNRAWTSGNGANDNRAITIECANYMDSGRYGQLPNATWNKVVLLCADIAKRYGYKRVVYTGSTNNPYSDGILLTMHKWFQDTDCPGIWFSNNFSRLAKEATEAINKDIPPQPTPQPINIGGLYYVNVETLNVRTAPSIKCGNVVAQYHRNQCVYLDNWSESNEGYIWGRYTGASSGVQRFVAIGKDTGRVEPDDYLIKK